MKQFFFEKKNQKTFGTWPSLSGKAAAKQPKVFCFFFSKKKIFLSRQNQRVMKLGIKYAKATSLCAWLALSCPAHAADPVAYTVKFHPTGNAALDGAVSGSSQLAALRKTAPAGPFALVARARQDLGRLQTALESFGYYAGTIDITIDGKNLEDPSLPDLLQSMPASADAKIDVDVKTGPLFHLGSITLNGTVPEAAKLKLKSGEPAVASAVLAAGTSLLSALQERGYALAKVDPPVATLHPSSKTLDIRFKVAAGPQVDIGPISFTGLKRMHEAFLRRRLLLVHQGQLYQPSKIEAARQALASVGAFSSVQVQAKPVLDAYGEIPLTFAMEERKLHAVSLNVGYSTDLGASAGVTWSHRDLFGNAEQLNLTAALTGAGGTADQGLGYDAKIQFIKPDYYRRDQTLEVDVEGLKQDLISYDQTAITAGPILTRTLSKDWSVSAGLKATQEQIIQEGVTRDYTLLALPVTAHYDGTGVANPLDDATHGVRATLSATPTESFASPGSTFVILQGGASTYLDLSALGLARPGRTVLALRGLVGSAQGADEFALPPDQRFYAGGSATVRGYKYQSVGPQFADGNPVGGTSIDAATIELRQRVWGPVGAAVFADAAQVSTRSAPFGGRLEEGVGAGVRYYTPIGPVRVDVAVPVTRQADGDSFELYLGLGQAF
jgi:translocation and assembly module TamA